MRGYICIHTKLLDLDLYDSILIYDSYRAKIGNPRLEEWLEPARLPRTCTRMYNKQKKNGILCNSTTR